MTAIGIDERGELRAAGYEPVLRKARWCLLKRPEMLRRHKPLLLNWFRARGEFSAGCVEGMNDKAKLTMKKACGFKWYNVAEVALLHTHGKLPTPQVTHRFW